MSLARRPFLALAGLALQPFAHARAETLVKGSGVAATQRRDIGAFVGVGLGSAFAVVLRPAAREAIEIVADDNILAIVQTRLEGTGSKRSLQIDLPRDIRVEPRTAVVVTIDYVHLESLAVGGSGSIAAVSMKEARGRDRRLGKDRARRPRRRQGVRRHRRRWRVPCRWQSTHAVGDPRRQWSMRRRTTGRGRGLGERRRQRRDARSRRDIAARIDRRQRRRVSQRCRDTAGRDRRQRPHQAHLSHDDRARPSAGSRRVSL